MDRPDIWWLRQNYRSDLGHHLRLDRHPAGAAQDEEISGTKGHDLELASLNTWMRVEETEQREKESSPIHPR